MTDATETIEPETTEAAPKKQKRPPAGDWKLTRGVLEVLQADGGPLRSIEIAKRCNNGVHILSEARRTTMQILEELNVLISTGKATIRLHPLGGNVYQISRGGRVSD